MSMGLRTREQLEHAARYTPATPRTRQEAGIHDANIYDGPTIGDALIAGAALVCWLAAATFVVWALLVLLFSVDERPIDIADHAERHYQTLQHLRGER